jgi:Polyprenyl synthetase/Aminotransferase class-V
MSRRRHAILAFCAALADLLTASPAGIVNGRSATQIAHDFSRHLATTWAPGDEVVVTQLDDDANVRPWIQAAAAAGVTVRWLRLDPTTAELCLDELDEVVGERTRLVAVTAASNLLGTKPPVDQIARRTHAVGALIYVDGCTTPPLARLTVDGQARDLGWQREAFLDLTPDDYLDMIMRKTCWYTTLLPLRVGALIGTQGRLDLSQLLRFGFLLGAAFQIRDDILNLTGSPDVYGKEPLGDLREGKPTLMLIHLAAAASPPDRAHVGRYLLMDPAERTTDVTTRILAMMGAYGSLAFLRRRTGPSRPAAPRHPATRS